jgi:hypothetical protein
VSPAWSLGCPLSLQIVLTKEVQGLSPGYFSSIFATQAKGVDRVQPCPGVLGVGTSVVRIHGLLNLKPDRDGRGKRCGHTVHCAMIWHRAEHDVC